MGIKEMLPEGTSEGVWMAKIEKGEAKQRYNFRVSSDAVVPSGALKKKITSKFVPLWVKGVGILFSPTNIGYGMS